ncbi:hypothetical protein AAVH_32860, partial [Aphelenchoides avenae]
MLPVEPLIDVLGSLDRSTLDIIRLSSVYLRDSIDNHPSILPVRRILMASASRSMKFEVQVQVVHPTAIENVAADYFNCQEALKWLLTRLRNTVIEELRFFDVVFMEPAMRRLREVAPTISLVKNLTVRPPF